MSEIGQFAPKPDWGVHEALAFANTLANHGWTPEANPDAASSCIYALCRILSSPGNAAALRRTLESMSENLAMHVRCGRFVAPGDHVSFPISEAEAYIRDIRAALSVPPRNCDKYGKYDVVEAFIRDTADGTLDPDAASEEQVDEYMREHWFLFRIWLFAKSEGGAE